MGLTVTKTGKTRILIFGAQVWSLSELFNYLELADLSSGIVSISIPTAVLELQAQWFTGTIDRMRHRIRSIEDTTGMRKPINPQDLQQPAQDWKELDMVPITGELSSLLSRLSFLKMQAEATSYLIQRMHQYTEALIDKSVGELNYMIRDQHEIFVKLENARGWYHGIMAQCDYLIRRTTAQTETDSAKQNQVYSLLASQNSTINIEIARASNVMAQLSRIDNQAMLSLGQLSRHDAKLMIEIARDSRSVALSTAQDSASMRILAIVTVLFLPATFTAVSDVKCSKVCQYQILT
ncbi:unnamed protein product [Penicillium bialowiezense]